MFDDPTILQQPDAAYARAEAALRGLTDPQRAAVTHRGTPLLVLAGAGSGKTRVISRRIVHLIATGHATPAEILATTFTTKAAREIKQRVDGMLGADAFGDVDSGMEAEGNRNARGLTVRTLHAAALKHLRDHADAAGLGAGFSILGGDDQHRLIRQILREELPNAKTITNDQVKAAIVELEALAGDPDREVSRQSPSELLVRLAATYSEAKARMVALDFNDLLLRSLWLLRDDPEVYEMTRERWTHVLVDEYQDTNRLQEAWIRQLVAEGNQLTVVGDDDQVLYQFRGAEASNILEFPKRYEAATVVRLDENFRSAGHILACANSIISRVEHRHGKTLAATRKLGRKVAVRRFLESTHEASWIARDIEAAILTGSQPNEIAVLARSVHALNLVEQALVLLRLPYRLSGGRRYADRVEVKDALAWLRLVANPADASAFERAAQAPKRGLGRIAIDRITAAASEDAEATIVEVARAFSTAKTLPPAQGVGLASMIDAIDEARRLYWKGACAGTIAGWLIEASGLTAMIKQAGMNAEAAGDEEGKCAAHEQLGNLADLITSARGEDLDDFLGRMGLGEAGTHSLTNAVFLGSVHSAKGLEFDFVYSIGWEDNLLPDWRALSKQPRGPFDSGKRIDEERRIAYVAMTRARNQLEITVSAERFGRPSRESRFLRDLPHSSAELWEMPPPQRS